MGGARAAASGGTADVFANALSFTPNTWNHYVINVTTGDVQWTPLGGSTTPLSTTGLNQLPALDAPADYDVLTYVKMEAAARNSGASADGYFDDFDMSVASPTVHLDRVRVPQLAAARARGHELPRRPVHDLPGSRDGPEQPLEPVQLRHHEHESVQGHVYRLDAG